MCSSSVSESEWYGGSSYGESFAEHPVFYGFTEAVFVSQFDMYSRNVLSSSAEAQEAGPLSAPVGSCESRGSLSELFANKDALVNRCRSHRTHNVTSTSNNAKMLPDDPATENNRRKLSHVRAGDEVSGELVVVDTVKRSLPIPIVNRKRISSFV